MAGRPTDYKPEYDDMIVEHMSKGHSAVSFAAKIGVAKMTVYQWEKDHPSFSDAFARARTMCQCWWEDQAVSHLEDVTEYQGTSVRFNDKLWAKNVACRFKDDWVERKDVSVSLPLDGDKSLLEALIAKPEVTK